MKTLRGTESRSIAKWQNQGWEFVDQSAGTLQTTLNFRRPKPPLPTRQIAIGAAVALLLAGVITVGALLEDGDGEDDRATPPSAASTEQSNHAPETETAEASGQVNSAPTPEPSTQPDVPPAPVVDTSVDELLDRLNAGSSGGVTTGDRFQVTAELFGSDMWGTGASGDYVVNLVAQGGRQDLQVFVDESVADGWRDGTRVQLVLEAVEATINGETTDGWLRVRSATTLSAIG
ncbi:hypothetical protein [Blastococcus sp. SYSU DS0617]